jgi:hypothetical protein
MVAQQSPNVGIVLKEEREQNKVRMDSSCVEQRTQRPLNTID